jgi:hypothetical protein
MESFTPSGIHSDSPIRRAIRSSANAKGPGSLPGPSHLHLPIFISPNPLRTWDSGLGTRDFGYFTNSPTSRTSTGATLMALSPASMTLRSPTTTTTDWPGRTYWLATRRTSSAVTAITRCT